VLFWRLLRHRLRYNDPRFMAKSRFSLPASTSCSVATAVNILFIEPMRNLVAGVFAVPALRSARPRASCSHNAMPRAGDLAYKVQPWVELFLSNCGHSSTFVSTMSVPLGRQLQRISSDADR
jgi:hypothetical protein